MKFRNVLITGASSGIGLAAAKLFAARGYEVVGTCRRPEAAPAIPGVALVSMDASDPASVEAGFAEATRRLGHIDVLINNAGMGELGAVEDTPMEEARRLFEVNYFSTVRLTRLCLPGMRKRGGGAVLQLGSIVFSLQFPFKAQYCASKAALSAFSLSLRQEVFPHGIRVHLFEPGWVRSEFHRRMRPVLREGSPYAERLRPFLDFSRDEDPRIPDGEAVARVLLETLENPRAPARIAVGTEARRFFLVSRFLSHQMLDRLLRWKLSRKEPVVSAPLNDRDRTSAG
jgi:NAD(P)-dependent dehydrogenase (short-subunit alcohol dehydrogenase family)